MKKLLLILAIGFSFSLFGGEKLSEIVPTKEEKDIICSLEPYKMPEFATQVEFKNGKKLTFSCLKCMMIFYYKNTNWEEFGAKSVEDIKYLKATDYKTHKTIDVSKGYFVYGSTLMGPKGDDLIPFEYEADAKEFMKDKSGKRIMTFADFKLKLFDYLNMK